MLVFFSERRALPSISMLLSASMPGRPGQYLDGPPQLSFVRVLTAVPDMGLPAVWAAHAQSLNVGLCHQYQCPYPIKRASLHNVCYVKLRFGQVFGVPGASFCTRHDKKPRLIRGPYQTCRNVAYLPVSIGVVVGQYRIMLPSASLSASR